MTGFFDCVMTVAAVEFQLSGVNFVAEWHRLFWLMPNVDDGGVNSGEQTRRQIASHR